MRVYLIRTNFCAFAQKDSFARERIFYFFSKKGRKKRFSKSAIPMQIYTPIYVGRIVLPVKQQKHKTRRIQKQCYSQLFLYFFL